MAQSSPFAAPLAPCGDSRHRKVLLRPDIHTHTVDVPEHCHRANVEVCGPVHNDLTLVWEQPRRGTIVVVACSLAAARLNEGQTTKMRVAAKAMRFRFCEVQVRGAGAIAVSLMSVQNDDLEIEVLTWAEMDSSAVQVC